MTIYEESLYLEMENFACMTSESSWELYMEASAPVQKGFFGRILDAINSMVSKFGQFISNLVTGGSKEPTDIKTIDHDELQRNRMEALNSVQNAKSKQEVDEAMRKYKKRRAIIIGTATTVAGISLAAWLSKRKKNASKDVKETSDKAKEIIINSQDEVYDKDDELTKVTAEVNEFIKNQKKVNASLKKQKDESSKGNASNNSSKPNTSNPTPAQSTDAKKSNHTTNNSKSTAQSKAQAASTIVSDTVKDNTQSLNNTKKSSTQGKSLREQMLEPSEPNKPKAVKTEPNSASDKKVNKRTKYDTNSEYDVLLDKKYKKVFMDAYGVTPAKFGMRAVSDIIEDAQALINTDTTMSNHDKGLMTEMIKQLQRYKSASVSKDFKNMSYITPKSKEELEQEAKAKKDKR